MILCVGHVETLEGEEGDTGNSYASGDKIDLQLPAPQRELMEVVAKSGKPVVLCVMSGSALDLSYGAEHFDAVLQLWYPGSEGGKAAAKVLFGEVSPSGKLPVTFYDGLDDLPAFEDYSMKGRTYRYMEGKAQYPFGYGLTYGDTAVTDARLADAETADDRPWFWKQMLRIKVPWQQKKSFRFMWKLWTAQMLPRTRHCAHLPAWHWVQARPKL